MNIGLSHEEVAKLEACVRKVLQLFLFQGGLVDAIDRTSIGTARRRRAYFTETDRAVFVEYDEVTVTIFRSAGNLRQQVNVQAKRQAPSGDWLVCSERGLSIVSWSVGPDWPYPDSWLPPHGTPWLTYDVTPHEGGHIFLPNHAVEVGDDSEPCGVQLWTRDRLDPKLCVYRELLRAWTSIGRSEMIMKDLRFHLDPAWFRPDPMWNVKCRHAPEFPELPHLS